MFDIKYSEHVLSDDIPKLDSEIKKRIKKNIENKLITDPVHFGKPLRYSLTGQRSLRVGDYRVVYTIDHDSKTVFVVGIGHRKEIYDSIH